ncbi:D-glycerate dehydrogenase [Halobacillus rhizosphaerae]|uniref:2-hydroxyacid dehydrogenase n=1 Tax=Halobacillus rhizosphaerae TaxID=3064889 RepID=UPI00398B65F7
MSKPSIFITRKLPEKVLAPYRDKLEIDMWEKTDEAVPREVLLRKAREADGLVTMLTESIDDTLLNEAANLKIVANMAVGYDNINVESARKHNIEVTNTPDVLTDTTADLAFGLLMTSARRIVEADQYVRNGDWKHWAPMLMAGSDIHHKTLGIVGMGRIGTTLAKRGRGFDMEILYHNRSRNVEAEEQLGAEYVSLEYLLKNADFVVCLAPLTDETYHMFDQAAFKHMKNDAIFINASRGALVNETALYNALVSKEIKGAGLDVFENEPISKDHPLLQLNQVVCLPHIGSSSVETRTKMMELALNNALRVLQGDTAITPV